MKKFLFFISLFVLNVMMVSAETIDVIPPDVHDISLSETSFNAGDKINFKVNASDDVSGIHGLTVEFADPMDYGNSFSVGLSSDSINGEAIYTGVIPKNVKSGEYYLRRISISDKVVNHNCYVIEGLLFNYNCQIKNFNIPNIHIMEDQTLLSTPQLESLTFSTSELTTNDSLVVKAKITDGAEVSSIIVMFGSSQYYFNKVGEYEYSTEIKFTTPGIKEFASFSIFDKNDNFIHYIYDSKYNDLTYKENFVPLPNNKYDVMVTGEELVKIPILKNITFSTKSFKAPGYFKVYLDIESDNLDDLDFQISFERENCEKNCGLLTTMAELHKENGKYYFEVGVGQYQDVGKYHVSSLLIIDKYNNQTLYATWEGNEYVKVIPMDIYSFEIVGETNADVTSSNAALDVVEKIKNAKDDSVISIDTSNSSKVDSKIFEAIKGTNKTISLESNGIRWIFNGKDIKNPKTIDISSEIILSQDYYSDILDRDINALIINFKNNGVLPGRVLIRIKADWTFRNYLGNNFLTVYYMNKNDFDLISDGVVLTDDGYYEFNIDHNSTYVLSNKKIDSDLVKNDYTEQLNNKKDNVVPDNPKVDNVVPDNPKVDNVVPDSPKVDNVVSNDTKVDNVVPNDTKIDNVVPNDTKIDNVVSNDTKVDNANDTKVDDVELDDTKIDNTVPNNPEVDNVVQNQTNNNKDNKPKSSKRKNWLYILICILLVVISVGIFLMLKLKMKLKKKM